MDAAKCIAEHGSLIIDGGELVGEVCGFIADLCAGTWRECDFACLSTLTDGVDATDEGLYWARLLQKQGAGTLTREVSTPVLP